MLKDHVKQSLLQQKSRSFVERSRLKRHTALRRYQALCVRLLAERRVTVYKIGLRIISGCCT